MSPRQSSSDVIFYTSLLSLVGHTASRWQHHSALRRLSRRPNYRADPRPLSSELTNLTHALRFSSRYALSPRFPSTFLILRHHGHETPAPRRSFSTRRESGKILPQRVKRKLADKRTEPLFLTIPLFSACDRLM